MNTARTDFARAFAYNAHLGQRYAGVHYIIHLDHAVDVLRRFDVDEVLDADVYEATYLHDTIEDTETTYDDLATVFSPEVAFLVDAVSDQEGENRKTRHARTYPRIRAAGPKALVVKLADRIANVEASISSPNEKKLAMYLKEYREFREALAAPDNTPVAIRMWAHLDNLLGWKGMS